MTGWSFWAWPFFEPYHEAMAARAAGWISPANDEIAEVDLPDACRAIAISLGSAGLLDVVVPPAGQPIDVRALCLVREALAYRSVLADTVIAMQGIGSAAIREHGTPAQKERYLASTRAGRAIAAFALTEPGSGSDVANIVTRAERDGDSYVLNGAKAYISNAPFADYYVLLARTGEAPGAKGLSAFILDAGTEGLQAGPPTELIAPHPAGPLTLVNCRVPASAMLGEAGRGFALAMATFDIFRTSVGAAAIGMARRALDETTQRVRTRRLFNGTMAELPGVQTQVAEMSVDVDLGALAVYRAAWAKDTSGGRCTREASMAKLVGTEAASRVIDRAVQLFGGLGVTRGCIIEQLYREIRASRIYEGASEVQAIVIGRSLLAGSR